MGYARPETLNDALRILAGGGRTILAGGTDLYPATTAQTLAGDVLDITGIGALKGVERSAEGWRIGACATWSDVIAAPLPPAFDMLKQAAREVGARQVQNAGTIAGNICNASPAADGVPALMALDAEVEVASATGARRVALSDFINGVRKVALGPGEMVSAVLVPEAAGRGGSAFEKLGARKHLVISIAMVAARVVVESGRIAEAAIAVGACSAVARRLPEVEAALAERDAGAPEIDAGAVAAALSPIDDMRGTAGYRREAAAELVRRAVRRAVEAAP